MKPPEAPPGRGTGHPPAWLTSTMVLWAAAAIASLMVAAAAGFAWWERRNAIDNELDNVEMLARALDDQSSRAVGTAAILGDAFREDLAAYDSPASRERIDLLLTQAIAGTPSVRSFSLVAADGLILASSNPQARGKRIDPERLPRLADTDNADALRIGKPVAGRDLADSELARHPDPALRMLPLSFVPLVRHVALRSGGDAYMVIALNTDYLANTFGLMLSDAGRTAALLHYDGTLLAATEGIQAAPGANFSANPVFRELLSQRDHGSLSGIGLDGEPALLAYRASRRWPLVVMVELGLDTALAGWQGLMHWVAIALAAGLALLGLVAGAAWRSLRSNEQVRAALFALHREIAASEARKSAILASAMDGMVTLDARGHILEFNHEAERIFGHRAQDALGRSLDALVFPPESRGALDGVARTLRGGIHAQHAGQRWELPAMRANGERFPLEVSVVPVESDGESILSCTLRDISEAKQAAEEREQLLERYRESSASLRVLKRALDQHAIVSIYTPEGVIAYANRKLAEVSGYRREELVGQDLRLLAPKGQREPIEHDPLALVRAAQAWAGQLVHQKKDGTLYWAASTIVPDLDAHGRLRQIFLIQTDISRQIAGERAIEAARRAELELGAGIQRALLTRDLPPAVLDCFLSGFNTASQGINGDFFDLFQFSEGCFDILVGDAMGKGVPAALLGAGLKMQFARSLAELVTRGGPADRAPQAVPAIAAGAARGNRRAPPQPAEIIAHVQRAMHRQLEELESFVTVCYLRIDRNRNTLTWVGCGHEETLLLGADGSHRFLANQHPPLGVLESADIEQSEVALGAGQTVVLYSDGVTDAVGTDGERFGLPRMTDTLHRLLGTHQRPGTIARGMQHVMQAYTADGRIADDMTMLVLQTPAEAAGAREWRFEMPRAMTQLKALHTFVEAHGRDGGLDEVQASALALAAVELASNAVRHGGHAEDGGPLEFIFRAAPDACQLELFYTGTPFSPPRTLAPDFSGGSEGGFGLFIIRESCDAVRYGHADGVNHATLVKRLHAALAASAGG
ncbi:SpoIIE family protein phosphatase [Cupriavidus malaysiensis]|uniref:PAS domain S-box protein n=1 Tax=Cupriavidus malaysiensis TaxID=367825 RepID=A0ABM6FFA4_9BURK|nr:SpoIIE family protein phosphatase [Cupriavidus malaysiensis]AOZ10515.1 hypothetical protein BKK80_33680 [Cupriavidus malaysiensis]